MSQVKRQAQIDAPVEAVWALVGNPERYPEWWPRIVEVSGERFEQGDEYAQVTRTPMRAKARTTMAVDRLDGLREVQITCQDTGLCARWQLVAAADGTFVDLEFGMDARRTPDKLFDAVLGQTYFRRWADQSLDGLRSAIGSA